VAYALRLRLTHTLAKASVLRHGVVQYKIYVLLLRSTPEQIYSQGKYENNIPSSKILNFMIISHVKHLK
jgi:hypothetical protein